MTMLPLPALNDPEGERLPQPLPPVVDAHVHLFPDVMFSAIWQWFERFGWPVRYQLKAPEVVEFLLSRGVARIAGLHYAHRPGMARHLNAYMAGLCSTYPQLTGTATVFPGEVDAAGILEEAFQMGLHGVKLHAHVQYFEMDSDAMHEICRTCAVHDRPLVMHVGREPKNPDYPYDRDPYLTCRSDKLEQLLKEYPGLRICVPHLGANEYDEYRRMVEQYDNLWLDTTMVLADYLPGDHPPSLNDLRVDRIMYGTDFPNIPYAWDREIKKLLALDLSEEALTLILGKNAAGFFGIQGIEPYS
jgi:predicted TIM-barrel fold metal-dependent hydrolase